MNIVNTTTILLGAAIIILTITVMRQGDKISKQQKDITTLNQKVAELNFK